MKKIYPRLGSNSRRCLSVDAPVRLIGQGSCQGIGLGLLTAALLALSPGTLARVAPAEEQGAVEEEAIEQAPLPWAIQAALGATSTARSTETLGYLPIRQSAWVMDILSGAVNSTVSGDHLVLQGSRSLLRGHHSVAYGNLILSEGDNNTAIGHNVQAIGGGYATGVGAEAVADGIGTTALGNNAKAYTENSIAVGSGSATHGGPGISKIAIGGDASAGTSGWTGAIALGGRANAQFDSVSIGYEAMTTASSSVALGRGSLASERNTVSVGNASTKRRIVNVADGGINSTSTDAVNGRQLLSARDLAQRGVTEAAAAQGTANTANSTANTAQSTADQALLNTKLVTQASASGQVRIGAENTGSALTVSNKNGQTRLLSGITNATLSATSSDAVSGQQLFATNQKVDSAGRLAATGSAISEANKAVAGATLAMAMGQSAHAKGVAAVALGHGAIADTNNAISLGSASRASGLSAVALGGNAKATHQNAVALGEASITRAANQISVGNQALKRKIVSVADASLSTDSDEAVTGRQLFASDQRIAANQSVLVDHATQLSAQDGRIALNRNDVDALRTAFDDFDASLDGVVKFSPEGSIDMNGGKVHGLAPGDISSAASTDSVTGGQLFETNEKLRTLEHDNGFVSVFWDADSVQAYAGWLGVAVGSDARASGNGATAVGAYAHAEGINSVAMGRGSHVAATAELGFALGSGSQVGAASGVALGSAAQVLGGAAESIALGSTSVARAAQTVSVGNDTLKRRIVNVGRGVQGDDVTTVSQLDEALQNLGGGARLGTGGTVVAPTYVIQGQAVSTVGDALTSLDGAVTAGHARVEALESSLSAVFSDAPSLRTDGRNQLTFAGASGMVLSNVANGAVAAGSRDAINGGQLHQVQQQLNGRIDGLEQQSQAQVQTRALQLTSVSTDTVADTTQDPVPPSGAELDTARVDSAPLAKAASSAQPEAQAPAAPMPQVDTAELEKMLSRANDYTNGAIEGVSRRLDQMDKRFDRMAAMSSAQAAMAMNTAGLATYNRLGAGIGHSEGESALAVGYQRVLNERGSATFSLNGAFTNSGEQSVGVGVGIGW